MLRNGMVLSNAERQARYRERIKLLAARGVMTSLQAEMLADIRRRVREWRRSIATFGAGRMWLKVNNIDQSTQHVEMLSGMISANEAMLRQYDPEGLTSDGNIEIGAASPDVFATIVPGRWVSYELDNRGQAIDLRLYDTEPFARADGLRPHRRVGQIGDDAWSITPAPVQLAYALVQQMPNTWWRALISGWSDLPEQIEASRDQVIAVMGQVARLYIKERLERHIPVTRSYLNSIKGWECVAISLEEDS